MFINDRHGGPAGLIGHSNQLSADWDNAFLFEFIIMIKAVSLLASRFTMKSLLVCCLYLITSKLHSNCDYSDR